MQKAMLLAGVLLAGVLAGCASQPPPAPPVQQGGLSLLAGPALWADPQNEPHPAFGWATLSSPPALDQMGIPRWWLPINGTALPEAISGLEHVAQASGVGQGAGIAMFGSLVVVPGFGSDTAIVDVSEPTRPEVLSTFQPQQGQHRGAAIIAYPDGRLVTVISTSSVIDVWDITDPTDPQPLPVLEPSQGSHKVGVVPGTPIVYNAASEGGVLPGGQTVQTATGVTEIFDLSDPEAPVHVQDFANGFSCHHVYFWNSVEQNKSRAICAGIEYTQIWDTADPRNPSVVVSVPVHHGVADTPSGSVFLEAFSHYAGLNQDGTVLLVGDENGGGGFPPGCLLRADTPLGALSTPVGAVWFYDVSTETDPRLAGFFSASQLDKSEPSIRSCTAHHGRLVPMPERDVLAMGFYGAGVVVIDFTDVAVGTNPRVLAQFADGSDTWETWYNQGYLFTGDLARGMDVLKLA